MSALTAKQIEDEFFDSQWTNQVIGSLLGVIADDEGEECITNETFCKLSHVLTANSKKIADSFLQLMDLHSPNIEEDKS